MTVEEYTEHTLKMAAKNYEETVMLIANIAARSQQLSSQMDYLSFAAWGQSACTGPLQSYREFLEAVGSPVKVTYPTKKGDVKVVFDEACQIPEEFYSRVYGIGFADGLKFQMLGDPVDVV